MCSGPNATSSKTVGLNSWSSGSWNTRPDLARIRRTVARSTTRSPIGPAPWVGSWMPLRCSISVLLPAPFGPTRATFSPARDRRGRAVQRLETVRVAEVQVLHDDRHRRRDVDARRSAGRDGRGRVACRACVVCSWTWSGGAASRMTVVTPAATPGPRPTSATQTPAGSARAARSPAARRPRRWRCRNSPSKPRACIAA